MYETVIIIKTPEELPQKEKFANLVEAFIRDTLHSEELYTRKKFNAEVIIKDFKRD